MIGDIISKGVNLGLVLVSTSAVGDHPKLAAFLGSKNANVQNLTGKEKMIGVSHKGKSEVSLATGERWEKEVVVALLSLVLGK